MFGYDFLPWTDVNMKLPRVFQLCFCPRIPYIEDLNLSRLERIEII